MVFLGCWGCGKLSSKLPDRKSDKIEVITEGHDPNTLDLQLIGKLREQGADLGKPREIRHYLYFPTASMAQRAGQRLRSENYEIQEKKSEATPEVTTDLWVVIASKETIVDKQTVYAMRMSMEQIAKECGGNYDGWEAAVQP